MSQSIEMSLEVLKEDVRKFVSLDLSAAEYSAEELFNRVVCCLHQLCTDIIFCEQNGLSKGEILQVLQPARVIVARSPFISRLQTWPRGYPGDFETIEYLCSQSATPAIGTIEHACEQYVLACAASQQHRNKVQHQAEMIIQAVTSSEAARILIIACGSCPDLALARHALQGKEFQCVLNDSDAEALAFAQTRLASFSHQIAIHHSDVLRLLRNGDDLGQFDLVLAGGLFDYLSDRQVVFIMRTVFQRLLRSSGALFFTNIAAGNPFRVLMGYLADWQLVERTAEDIVRLSVEAGVTRSPTIGRDQTGLTLIVHMTNDFCHSDQ